MSRLVRFTALAIAGLLISSGTSPAQNFGVGVGVYPYGSYNGFWSNGFSLYGPPVPTYGTVPGTFGGADQRLSNFSNIYIQNGASIGLGNPGAGGGGPRRRFYSSAEPGNPTAASGQATIDVRVPVVGAQVSFEGNNTQQSGVRRMFLSPSIQVGMTYYYKVRATWKQPDGTVVDQERSVGVRARETTVVDFTPAQTVDKRPIVGVQ